MKKMMIALVALSGLAMADMVQLGSDLTYVSSITPSTLPSGNSQLTIDTDATAYTAPLTDFVLTFQFTAVSNYNTDGILRIHNNEGLCIAGNDDNNIFICSGYQSKTPLGGVLAGDTTSTFALTVSGTNNVAYLSNLSTGEVVTVDNLSTTFADGMTTFTNSSPITRFYTNGAAQKLNLGQVANLTGLTADQVAMVAAKGTTVPEPATATLSLLALAGLAARRRRH